MNKRIRKKKLKALIGSRIRTDGRRIIVSKEEWDFLQDLLKRPPVVLPWVREVPRKLFLDF